MEHTAQQRDAEPLVRRDHHEDRDVLVVDLGGVADVSVDAVDDTAIVVLERDGEPVQREFELPDGEANTFINNGVVTVEVRR